MLALVWKQATVDVHHAVSETPDLLKGAPVEVHESSHGSDESFHGSFHGFHGSFDRFHGSIHGDGESFHAIFHGGGESSQRKRVSFGGSD